MNNNSKKTKTNKTPAKAKGQDKAKAPSLALKEPKDPPRVMNLEKSRTLISKILLGLILFALTFFCS